MYLHRRLARKKGEKPTAHGDSVFISPEELYIARLTGRIHNRQGYQTISPKPGSTVRNMNVEHKFTVVPAGDVFTTDPENDAHMTMHPSYGNLGYGAPHKVGRHGICKWTPEGMVEV